ncbi:MAG: hypothetical protein EYC71_01330 [Gammaproteobacteria bacterium]|nr:MAG: hypothetical protein EYC71_01330 [Gammaproteobacteria bacterium]
MNVSKVCTRLSVTAALALAVVFGATASAQERSARQNLVQLISSSQSIVAGTVTTVSDGIDGNGLPYTEVTLMVGASPKGSIKQGAYTFRQFGLLKPRTLPNGKRMLMVTPEQFPQWREDEYVVAFLYHPASKTGLQTTAGLAQGKLVKVNDKLVNAYGNVGLFDNISADAGVLSSDERALLDSKGPVKTDTLLGLIHHIVSDKLVERGAIR